MNHSRVSLLLVTERSGPLPPGLAHPSFLLLPEKSPDGGLDAFLLTGLVERILAAVGAAAICRETWAGRDEEGNQRGGGRGERGLIRPALDLRNGDLPAKLPGVVEHGARVGEGHPVQAQSARSGRRRGIQKSQGAVVIFAVLEKRITTRSEALFSGNTKTLFVL